MWHICVILPTKDRYVYFCIGFLFFLSQHVQIIVISMAGELPEELGKLANLEHLLAPFNDHLNGSIPSSIFNISSLKRLFLQQNLFSGNLPPDMGLSLPNLQQLGLFFNRLSGKIPSSINNATMLTSLEFAGNSFTGSVPVFSNLRYLERLALSENNLTGAEFLSSLTNCPFLKSLEISYNPLMAGILPSSIGNFSTSLQIISASFCDITGGIPSEIGKLTSLLYLYLDSNQLEGYITSDLCQLRMLGELNLSENFLTGPIPECLGEIQSLRSVAFALNKLNSTIPLSFWSLTDLVFLELQSNYLSGKIPPLIGNLKELNILDLSSNQLTGFIPTTIRNLTNLQVLNLGSNQLEGSIPNDVCRMNELGELILAGNMLVGPIPECLGDVKFLEAIDLSSNQLNLTIPPSLWNCEKINFLNLSRNNFVGQLSYELLFLKIIHSLDLSFNKFSDEIPSTIDGCQLLEILNLSNNRFRGFIPNSLGNVKGLTALDLSYNNLSGSIPNSFVDLPSLEQFNISNNKLEGRIPDRGCFANLTAQSFAHNFALCGPIRFLVQPCPQDDVGSRVKKDDQFIKYMVLSLMLAVIVVIVMLVLIWRRKRKRVPLSIDVSTLTIEWIRMRNRRRISYIELERGTSSFSETNLLGRGNYGYVFRATLADGLQVAVKVFNLQLQGAAKSFDTETEILGTIRHRNLVRLVGWCSYREFRALVLTYMPNGSLDEWLHSNMYGLNLIQRLKIAIDVAAALEYLHHGYTFPVVHCDIKPSNVLLDQDMVAHLADFGISKLFDGGEAVIHTQTPATIGYAAPELGTEGKVFTNGDVYSFGIMLLEMFTGKKPTDDVFGEKMSLKEWASEALQHNAANEIVAPALLSSEDQHSSAKEQCVTLVFELAMKCLAVSPHERINMIEVATTLHKIKETIVATTERPRLRYAYSQY